jgi:hypothetical protein
MFSSNLLQFLGASAKFRKVTASFVMSIRLSVRTEQIDLHWMVLDKNLYLGFLRKSVEKINDLLKYEKKNEYFT